jgi:hypothetical protein
MNELAGEQSGLHRNSQKRQSKTNILQKFTKSKESVCILQSDANIMYNSEVNQPPKYYLRHSPTSPYSADDPSLGQTRKPENSLLAKLLAASTLHSRTPFK